MANIKVPDLPQDGSDIMYGPRCVASTTHIMDSGKGILAHTPGVINLKRIQTDEVPYVNAWLKATGQSLKVETYWRTKELRIVSTDGTPAPKVAPVAATAPAPVAPAPVMAPAPLPVHIPTEVALTPVMVPVATTTLMPLPAPAPKLKVRRKRIDGIEYTMLGDICVPSTAHDTMVDGLDAVNNGEVNSIAVTGPSGTAKTLMVEAFAASEGIPFVIVEGGNIRTADDWFGTLVQNPITHVWEWHWNEFGSALIRGDACIVLLDEANRAESVAALNAVMGPLSKLGRAYVSAASAIVYKPKGMLVFVTANIGAEYVATQPFDHAVKQRFGNGIKLKYLPTKVEKVVLADVTGIDTDVADKLVNMAEQQRGLKDDVSQFPSGTGISTRMLCDISARIVRTERRTGGKVDPRPAIESNFNAQFDDEDFAALNNVLDMHFPPSANDVLDVDTESVTEESES